MIHRPLARLAGLARVAEDAEFIRSFILSPLRLCGEKYFLDARKPYLITIAASATIIPSRT
jgi:hypothetical protein